MFLRRNGFENGDWGKSRDPNGLYGTQEAFGKASFPQNQFKKLVFPTLPGFQEFWEGAPGPLCISYGPFVGPVRPYVCSEREINETRDDIYLLAALAMQASAYNIQAWSPPT